VTPAPSYTFTGVTAGHTINVTFKPVALAVEAAPLEFALGRVIPNPMFGSMRVQYGYPTESAVRLSIMDMQGREVAVLASGHQPPAGIRRLERAWPRVAVRRRALFPAPPGGSRAFVQRFVLTR
jgi:hypothetical protein